MSMKKTVRSFCFRWKGCDYRITAIIDVCDCGLGETIQLGGPDLWLSPNPLPSELHQFAKQIIRTLQDTKFTAVDVDDWRQRSSELLDWQRDALKLVTGRAA